MSDQPAQVNASARHRFEVRVRPDRDVVHVEPAGELDMATAPQVRREVEALVATGFTRVVIDLRALEFIDGSGLRLLLALDAAARSDGWRLSLTEGPEPVQRLFTLTGTLDALTFTSTDGRGEDP